MEKNDSHGAKCFYPRKTSLSSLSISTGKKYKKGGLQNLGETQASTINREKGDYSIILMSGKNNKRGVNSQAP